MASPVASLTAGPPGNVRLWSQRRLETYPLTNCRFYAFAQALWWAGLRWPSGAVLADLIDLLRKATDVPEIDPKTGRTQGTTAADLERAVAKVLPWISVESGLVADAPLWRGLAAGEYYVNIAADYGDLPERQRRWSPGFTGGHMLGFGNATNPRGQWSNPQVLLLDPLGYGDYDGDWVEWQQIRPAMSTYGPYTFATTLRKEAALKVLITAQRAWPETPATAEVAKQDDLRVFRLTADADFQRGPDVSIARTTPISVDMEVIVDRRPSEPPTGRYFRVASGAGPIPAGAYLRAQDVSGLTPPASVDVGAIEAAAFTRGITAGRAEFVPYPPDGRPLFTAAADPTR